MYILQYQVVSKIANYKYYSTNNSKPFGVTHKNLEKLIKNLFCFTRNNQLKVNNGKQSDKIILEHFIVMYFACLLHYYFLLHLGKIIEND